MVSLMFTITSLRSCSCSRLPLPRSRRTLEGEDLLEGLLRAIDHHLDAEALHYHLPAPIGIYLLEAPSPCSLNHLIPPSLRCGGSDPPGRLESRIPLDIFADYPFALLQGVVSVLLEVGVAGEPFLDT